MRKTTCEYDNKVLTTIKETEHEIKETDSKFQLNLLSTEYSNVKEQVSKNQEVTI